MKTTEVKAAPKKKTQSRSLFYRISARLHLWLGPVSGLIMLVVCLTACIWVFQDEITALTEPETKVAVKQQPVLTPSQLMQVADSVFPGKRANYATYQQGRAITMALGQGRSGNTILRIGMNQYPPKDGVSGYVGITTNDGVSAVYKINATTATATRGLVVEGGTITAINRLDFDK